MQLQDPPFGITDHQTISRFIKNRLKIFCDRELKDDPQYADKAISIKVRKGYPPEEILMMADDLNCDVIVMGTHGRG
ncbi:MAG: universal stress protein, partial [Desulfobacteraceae bacterium]|nr:universal stress protein [Desulfobacteraceae bacterium]